MNNCFKRFLAFVLFLAMILSLSGCYSSYDDSWDNIYNDDYYDNPWGNIGGDDYSEDNYSYYDSSDSVSSNYYPSDYYPFYSSSSSSYQSTSSIMSGYNPNYNSSSKYTPSYSQTSSQVTSSSSSYSPSSAVSSKIEEPTYPKIYNLVQMRDLLKKNLNNNNLVIEFEYLGTESFNAGEIARMVSACYVSFKIRGNVYTVTITEYPGDRIVDAYFSGDKSILNSDEIKAMNKAIEIVNKAKASTSDSIDLEVYLHDYICKTVIYDDNTRSVKDPMNPPRNLSAVGGLLDGRANCQGYTDTFYVLASIAGFKVDRMYVKTSNDLHVANTIYLGGQWLLVDATFNDSEYYGAESKEYHIFNASKDVLGEYSWPDHYEMNPIASVTTKYYYYKYYNCYYTSADAFANAILSQYQSGKTEIHGAIAGGQNAADVSNALSHLTGNAGIYVTWRYFYSHINGTYYCQFLMS